MLTSPREYSPVLYRPGQRQSLMTSFSHAHICNCHRGMPQNTAIFPEVMPEAKRSDSQYLNTESEDRRSDNGDESSINDSNGTRVVSIQRHPVIGTGLRIIGGNSVGIFVSEVNPHSPAADAGIKQGDEIIAVGLIMYC